MGWMLGRKVRYLRKDYPSIWCPGCQRAHGFPLDDSNVLDGRVHKWTFNGNGDAPSFSPSMNYCANSPPNQCHSIVTDGRIQFLGDCYHELRGTTVDLPDWPEEKGKYYGRDVA